MPLLELCLSAAVLAASLLLLRWLGITSARTLGLLGALAAALGLGVALGPRASSAALDPDAIAVQPTSGYAGSGACRSCHPGEYDSWHQSFHRSMTQAASAEAVRAPWSGHLEWRGTSYELFRRGEEFWVTMPDPDRLAAAARLGQPLGGLPGVERRVLMTTGSHHYQAYWVPGARGNELWQLPFVYHFESARFIPRHDVFLQPEDDPAHVARWNSNCIQCHSVAGEPRHDLASDRFDSRAVELGIACEACHGPGAEHVARERDPLLRWSERGAKDAPRAIINPARLDAQRGSEVCGQCHGYFLPRAPERWWASGFADDYQPGQELERSRRLLRYERGAPDVDPELDASLESLFYPDGTIRVGGREWNGLSRSACFTEGRGDRQLGCTSCHQMHGAGPDDQLSSPGDEDAPCRGCHAQLAPEHSHHVPGSSGSRCVGCHMPKTTYALFKSIRSHRITRPVADRAPGAALGACNACHQDRSLEWTARWLDTWFPAATARAAAPRATATPASPTDGGPPSGARDSNDERSALAVAALSGDAAARVVAVAALGDTEARAVSGSGWQAQVLAEALDDPYAAVRFVAARSLRTFPEFAGFDFDFIAPRAERLARQAEARERAARAARPRTGSAPSPLAPSPLPSDAAGCIQKDVLEALAAQRDPRPIRIAE